MFSPTILYFPQTIDQIFFLNNNRNNYKLNRKEQMQEIKIWQEKSLHVKIPNFEHNGENDQ